MKTGAWWLFVFTPGLLVSFLLLVNADIIAPDVEQTDSCYWEYDEETGEEYEVCASGDAPSGDPFFEYIERIPIPEHPAVAWTAFGVVMSGVLARGTIIPMITAIDKARDNSRFGRQEK